MSSSYDANVPKVRIPAHCGACPIRTVTICRAFAPDQLHLAAALKTGDRILRAGSVLLRQGDMPTEFFHIVDGWFAVRQETPEGDRIFVDVVLPGAYVWYVARSDEALPVTIEALSTASVCVYDRRSFGRALLNNVDLAIELARCVSDERNRVVIRLRQLEGGQARTRLIAFLLDLWDRAVESIPHRVHGNTIAIPLTQSDFAEALSMTPVYVNRHLRSLKDDGLIEYHNRVFEFLDIKRLRAEVENHGERAT